jgi:hypothetical protein
MNTLFCPPSPREQGISRYHLSALNVRVSLLSARTTSDTVQLNPNTRIISNDFIVCSLSGAPLPDTCAQPVLMCDLPSAGHGSLKPVIPDSTPLGNTASGLVPPMLTRWCVAFEQASRSPVHDSTPGADKRLKRRCSTRPSTGSAPVGVS